ncbi:MAG: 16S rRNA (guanine(527)-N(7))-methyltransferase RsmG [Candidatus Thioglobus sp.]|uniref:16S rRNA (guanine(527)-N(7))-methyltransferase RsmG n=1 Tax=Candidatus Thioglobus sp. TaxID=2026721 RepID=UPI001EB21F67|nr:16S rRNA (guanine(527)-N(7))-methyltransferase RsmG [Candidatus Thioglobus sp.]MBT3186747.1 16S rRNA (guanine(527)-N(7))-methyltransferase RsmG [Candidatus Thioglobus sp.]
MNELKQLLQDGADQMGLLLSDQQSDQLLDYLMLIFKWNKTYNLSAIRDLESGVKKHLLDSLSILPYIGNEPLLDVGAGAGLPGIVLAIVRPELSVSVLDSVGKKCRFMQFAKTQLKLDNLTVVNQRVEDFQATKCFVQITSRAFAEVDKTLKLTQHLLCDNGRYLLMKGDHFSQEAIKGVRMISHQINVPYVSEDRFLLEIQMG